MVKEKNFSVDFRKKFVLVKHSSCINNIFFKTGYFYIFLYIISIVYCNTLKQPLHLSISTLFLIFGWKEKRNILFMILLSIDWEYWILYSPLKDILFRQNSLSFHFQSRNQTKFVRLYICTINSLIYSNKSNFLQ